MMNKLRSLLGLAVIASAPHALAQVDRVSIEAFSKQPSVTGVSMSLEGDVLVGLVADPSKDGEEMAAAYWDLSGEIDTTKPLLPSNITPSGTRTNFFAANALKQKKSLWFTVQAYTGSLQGCGEGKTTGSTKKYIQKVYMGNERIKKIDDLPNGSAEVGASKVLLRCFELEGETGIASLLPLDSENVLLSRTTTKNGVGYFLHNLRTGREKFQYRGKEFENYLISDRTGEPYGSTELEFTNGEWQSFINLRDPATGRLTREDALTTNIEDRYTLDIYGFHSETNQYFVGTDKFSDKVSVYMYDASTDQFSSEPVFAHPEFDISGIEFSTREQDFGAVLGFTYLADVAKTYWLDPEMDSIQKGLDAAFPNRNVSLGDMTADRNRILFTVSSGSMPTAYFLLIDKAKVATIGSSRPWIDPADLGETELTYITARDGLKVPSLVTYPPNFQKGKDKARGAIIHPHGGPWARDFAGFDNAGWVQYFANRGYIILRPQYRGSTGFGRALWLAGDKEWGQKMQDDKDDTAAWLVSQGYVDADKIAIHGYSYGGFAAIAASVRPNSPYQCAIAGAGVADLAKLGNVWGDNRIQRVVQGQTVKGMDPMRNTEKVNIPIQLYHGDYDVRVPLFHSRDFYNAIKRDSPQSELIVLKQMGHQSNKWLPEHKADVLENMERFLTTTCGM
jgi:dienelactone hydrolase